MKRHELPRHEVQQVICSLCGTEQEVQLSCPCCLHCNIINYLASSVITITLLCYQVRQVCISCGVCMGKYFCEVCKLFDDDVSKKNNYFDCLVYL